MEGLTFDSITALNLPKKRSRRLDNREPGRGPKSEMDDDHFCFSPCLLCPGDEADTDSFNFWAHEARLALNLWFFPSEADLAIEGGGVIDNLRPATEHEALAVMELHLLHADVEEDVEFSDE